jgi:hypothetical protein
MAAAPYDCVPSRCSTPRAGTIEPRYNEVVMVIQIVLAAFLSLVFGFGYLSGMIRVMSGLLIGFGVLSSFFFGVLFIIPNLQEVVGTPVLRPGGAYPFFVLALVLSGFIAWLFTRPLKPAPEEPMGSKHIRCFAAGLLVYPVSLFVPAFFLFPSSEQRLTAAAATLEVQVLIGVLLFLVGMATALYLLYKATRGTAPGQPDMMRRFVLALFAVLHLDKMPALITYLLIYSPETGIIFPQAAALALAGYVLIGVFLVKVTGDAHSIQ